MSVLNATIAKGKALFEAGILNYTQHDDSSDNKDSSGNYSHNPLEGSATEADNWASLFLYFGSVAKSGGGALTVYNNSGSSIIAGPVAITGYNVANSAFTIGLATAAGASPAIVLLLSSLANNTAGVAYVGGTFTSGIDTTASTVGNPVYLAVGGACTLTAPSGADQIQQVIGRVQTLANPGVVSGLISQPIKYGTSYLQTGSLTFDKIGGGSNTTAAMTVGTGATLGPTGTGTVTANAFSGVLPVANGGLGVASPTAHAVLLGEGTSAVTPLAVPASGTILQGVAAADPTWTATPTLGVAGVTKGTLALAGNTSGTATIQPTAAAGNITVTVPPTTGTLVTTGDAGTVTTGMLDTTNNGGAVHQWENILDNPQGKVAQRPASNFIGLATPYGSCDRWRVGLTAGTGTIGFGGSQDTAAPNGNSGYAVKLNITAVTSGTAVFRQYIEKRNAVKLLNRTAIFSVNVRHDYGSNINFVLNMYPMTADDNGTLGTVASSKNIWVTDAQLQLGSTVTPCEERGYHEELQRCQRYCFVPSFVDAATYDQAAVKANGTAINSMLWFPVTLIKAPAFTSNVSGWVASAPGSTQISYFEWTTAAYVAITGALTVSQFRGNPTSAEVRCSAATSFGGTIGNSGILQIGSGVQFVFDADF